MILMLKQNHDKEQLEKLKSGLLNQGLELHFSEGKHTTILGLIGDTSKVDIDLLMSLEIVA